jgi:hypothetical protein
MSADARLMTKKAFVRWAAEAVQEAMTLQKQGKVSELMSHTRWKEVAQACYFHKEARTIMLQAGYIDQI